MIKPRKGRGGGEGSVALLSRLSSLSLVSLLPPSLTSFSLSLPLRRYKREEAAGRVCLPPKSAGKRAVGELFQSRSN